ncbi:hypothetical protein LLEC1_00314 [Akanthomyces lecanii]|uniref:Tafazzin family protein n=1 Tax=Cordyceps confragosa TaxID=2714763 RepID=A0A179ICE0_CORDF|nr:hypothetical protein LLEC1_00314 [Akanthomyces lecanii]
MSGSSSPSSPPPLRRGLGWRLGSTAVMASVGAVCRGFLYAFNTVEVTGLQNLLGALDRRKTQGKDRGLITVCNHLAVCVAKCCSRVNRVDDPLIWGILPMRYTFDVENLRWSLAAHDICFKNRAPRPTDCQADPFPSLTSAFFNLGQTLPTHRLWHSELGGLKTDEELRHGPEALQLRTELAKAVREEILKMRATLGLPKEEDDTAALAETWDKEPNKRRFKSPVDGSLVNRH